MRTIELTKGREALVDDDDYDRLIRRRWRVNKDGYAEYCTGGTHMLMHRMIMMAVPGEQIDHINHDRCDNRKENLRYCTSTGQARNRKPRPGKFKGISLHRGRWAARITVLGKSHALGYYDTPEEAARAYDEAALRLHGDFAATNEAFGLLKPKDKQ